MHMGHFLEIGQFRILFNYSFSSYRLIVVYVVDEASSIQGLVSFPHTELALKSVIVSVSALTVSLGNFFMIINV
jgi:hypothetical protein